MQWSAAESVWFLGNKHEISVSCKCGFRIGNFAVEYQMVLRHRVLPAWEQYHLQTELLTLQRHKNPLLFLRPHWVWPWTCYLDNTQTVLEFFSDCLFPTPHPSYISARVLCQWLWQDTSQTSSHKRWYPLSLWIFFHCAYLSADIGFGGKGGYTDDWHQYLRNLYPSEETAMLNKW